MNGSLFGGNSSDIESLDYDEIDNNTTSILDNSIPGDNTNYNSNSSVIDDMANQKIIDTIESASFQAMNNNGNSQSNDENKSDVFTERLNQQDNSNTIETASFQAMNNEANSQSNDENESDVFTERLNQQDNSNIVDEEHTQFYVFKCKDCSITFGKYGLTDNNKCVYCGKSNLETIDGTDDSFPYIIPFNYSLDDAITAYKKYISFNPLIPNIFKSKSTISSISKIYVSSELFDINLSGDVSFYAGDKSIVNDKEELKKYDVKNTVNFDFKNVLMCGNSKISMPIFLGISNYDFQQIKQYDSNFVSDSSILLSDLSPLDISNFASNMVMDYSLGVIRKNVNHQLKKVNKNNIAVNFSNNKLVLVPLYILNVNYKGKVYTYLMNGSTGKTTMKIVYGKKEIIIFSILLFILIFTISLLFVFLV